MAQDKIYDKEVTVPMTSSMVQVIKEKARTEEKSMNQYIRDAVKQCLQLDALSS